MDAEKTSGDRWTMLSITKADEEEGEEKGKKERKKEEEEEEEEEERDRNWDDSILEIQRLLLHEHRKNE